MKEIEFLKSKKVLVLYGGWSREREVSLRSGKKVYESLKRMGFDVSALDMGKDFYERIKKIHPGVFYIPWVIVNLPVILFSPTESTWLWYSDNIFLYNIIMYSILLSIAVYFYSIGIRMGGESGARTILIGVAMALQSINNIIISFSMLSGVGTYIYLYLIIMQSILVPFSIIIIAYAVMKYNLIYIHDAVKKSTLYGLLSLSMVIVFVVVEETLENLISATFFGRIPLSSIIAAITITLTVSPIERRIEKLVNRIFPELVEDENIEMKKRAYAAAVKGALADGIITEKERKLLIELRRALELPEDVVREIEEKYGLR